MTGRRMLQPLVIVGAAALSMLIVGASLAHGMGVLHRQQRVAHMLDDRTAVVNTAIAEGRFAAAHLASERSRATALAEAIPPTVDDQSILASAVSASLGSGVTMSDEQRGAASVDGAGVTSVSVTLDVNAATAGALVDFAGALERQPRRFVISELEFSSEGGATLHATGSVFTAPATAGIAPPP